jgi:hypothetical protein
MKHAQIVLGLFGDVGASFPVPIMVLAEVADGGGIMILTARHPSRASSARPPAPLV